MAWAAALGRRMGRVDVAVALYRSVTARRCAAGRSTRWRRSSSKPRRPTPARPPVPERDPEAARDRVTRPGDARPASWRRDNCPIDQAGEAGLLITAGRAADAVAILQTVLQENSAQATRTAVSLLPATLLAAGEEDLTHDSYLEAAQTLQQLVAGFPGSAEALQAAAMLAAPQVVSGTLVTHGGAPVSARVRLSSNYKAEPGGMYQTNGPFYYTNADSQGTSASAPCRSGDRTCSRCSPTATGPRSSIRVRISPPTR